MKHFIPLHSSLIFLGINILIFGSMIPVIHYLFYCSFKLKTIYIGVLIVLSIASIIVTSSAACSKPYFRPFKAILFIALGLYGKLEELFDYVSCSSEMLHCRRCPSCPCMHNSWFSTNVSNGFHLFGYHGSNLYCWRCCLRSSCSRTILSG